MKVKDAAVAAEEDALVMKLREAPGSEEIVSYHTTYEAAKVRASQMRRSAKWSSLPLALRPAKTTEDDPNFGDYDGVVLATYTGHPPDGTLRGRVVFELDIEEMDMEERKAFGREVAKGIREGGSLELPARFVRARHITREN